MNPDDLIRIAEHLASGGVRGRIGRPVQAELRRAVSATYYALFHALSRCCANMLVGATPASRSQQAWRQVYRALEHGHAKNQCSNRNMLSRFPQKMQEFAGLFVAMQRQRQDADYDPYAQFFRSNVLRFIDQAKEAISEFGDTDARDQRAFAVHVLFRVRQLTHPSPSPHKPPNHLPNVDPQPCKRLRHHRHVPRLRPVLPP